MAQARIEAGRTGSPAGGRKCEAAPCHGQRLASVAAGSRAGLTAAAGPAKATGLAAAGGLRVATGVAVASGLAVLLVAGCARGPHPALLPSPGAGDPVGELRRTCPAAISARVRIRLEPEKGTGITIDGTLKAILPDTLSLSARLGIFRPFFALRADADSTELLLHEARHFWVTARTDEDWRGLNPSAWARVLAWALCPADLLDRLDGIRPAGGDERIRTVRGRLRGSPFEAELGVERRVPRLASLRVLEGETVVMEMRQRDFRHVGDAWVPRIVETRMPRHGLTARIEIIDVSASRPDPPPAVERTRPPGWDPVHPGEPFFVLPGAGQDPG